MTSAKQHFERVNYATSPAPAFDAVEQLKSWIGLVNWPSVLDNVKSSKCAVCFIGHMRSDVEDSAGEIPDIVWISLWDLVKGQGDYVKQFAIDDAEHRSTAFACGKEAAQNPILGFIGSLTLTREVDREAFEAGRQSVLQGKN